MTGIMSIGDDVERLARHTAGGTGNAAAAVRKAGRSPKGQTWNSS